MNTIILEIPGEQMKGIDHFSQHPIRISFVNNLLFQGKGIPELGQAVKEGMIIRSYLNAEISLGEMAELMGMTYSEAREWLNNLGIPTLRKFNDSDLEKTEEGGNYEIPIRNM
jgi:predicted HTH domain antitoxin